MDLGVQMIKTYRKIPVEIEAVYWDGSNLEEVKEFLGDSFVGYEFERRLCGKRSITVKTLEGEYKTPKDYYFIKGVEGEFYPCEPNIFNKTYIETHPLGEGDTEAKGILGGVLIDGAGMVHKGTEEQILKSMEELNDKSK